MTEKLFYQDSYLSEFCAKVLSCTSLSVEHSSEAKYEAVLDRTAFFRKEEDRAVIQEP